MTEERKQELRQLLEEARKSLVIRYGYGGSLSIPMDVYRRYLEERWTYYGIDFLSFASSIDFAPDVADGSTKSNLLDFIREELAPFIVKNSIPTASYVIEANLTDESHLSPRRSELLNLSLVLERLLQITLVRGIEEAVSVFHRYSSPEGAHYFFQDVALLEGIMLEKEIPVFEGVRLVPLPSSETSDEVECYLPGFPSNTFTDPAFSFFGKTLLVIDRPGFSILREHTLGSFLQRLPVDDLPLQIEVRDVKFPNSKAVNSFRDLFCRALSLVCSSPVEIVREGLFVEEDKSFNPHHTTLNMFTYSNPFNGPIKAGKVQIDEAKHLYGILDKESDIREKLRIPINRWIKSKTLEGSLDQIIDLGIAFEALYVPDGGGDLTYKFSIRAARHLGKNKEDRNKLLTKFKQIYNCRSSAVHSGQLDQTVKFGKKRIPVFDFIENAQDLCRKSIKKILEDGEFPDWDSLLLGGEEEQASS